MMPHTCVGANRLLTSTLFGGAVVLLVLAGAVSAQYRSNLLFWSDDPKCGSKRLVNTKSKIKCGWRSFSDRRILTLDVPEMEISIFPIRLGGSFSLYLKVKNQSSARVLLEPNTWSVASYASEQAFKAGDAPMLNETALPAVESPAPRKNSSFGEPIPSYDHQAPTKPITSIGNAADPGKPTRIPEGRQQVVIGETEHVGNPRGSAAGVSGISLFRHFERGRLVRQEIIPRDSASGVTYFNVSPESSFHLLLIHLGEYSFVFEIRQSN